MLAWLSDLGFTVSAFGEYKYMIYAAAVAISVLMISSIVSVIFGVIVGVFNK